MKKITIDASRIGRLPIGIKTPIIRTGDDLVRIVIDSCLKAVGEFHEGAIIGVTEAVVAIAEGNYATPEDIRADIARKYPDADELTLLFPIQSRNRFLNIPRAIAEMEQIKHIQIVLSYPCDEVGNRLVSDEVIRNVGINHYRETFIAERFYKIFGKPCHPFTEKNYIEEFEKACNGKANIFLSNDPNAVSFISNNFLVCTIREQERKFHKKMVAGPGKTVWGLDDILSEPVNGSGYSPYGLYGSNMMDGGKLKLMPRNSKAFVEKLQKQILDEYGVHVEAMVFGDGAFKDPVGGIWELADPETTPGATSGLSGTPKEVKLKFLASKYPDLSQEELQKVIAEEKKKRLETDDVAGEASLGTTPRRKTDILASLMDLTTGSGDLQTPVVYIYGFD